MGQYGFSILYVVPFLWVVFVMCFVSHLDFRHREALMLLGVLALGIRLAIAFGVYSEPVSDFQIAIGRASEMVYGEFSYKGVAKADAVYDYIFVAFQNWYSYTAVIMKMVGLDAIKPALLILNSCYGTITNILVYLFVYRYTQNVKCGLFAGFLFLLLPDARWLDSVLTNQHFSACFSYIGLYLIAFSKSRKKRIIIGSLLIAIGYLVRYDGLFPFAAALVLIVLNKDKLKNRMINIGLSAGTFTVVTMVLISAMIAVGWRYPTWTDNSNDYRFAAALDSRPYGAYSEECLYMLTIVDDAERREYAQNYIEANRPHSLKEWWDFFGMKLNYQYAYPVDYYWQVGDDALRGHSDVQRNILISLVPYLLKIGQGYMLVLYLLLPVYCVYSFIKHRAKKSEELLMPILFCGFFAYTLFGQIQARYKFIVLPALCIIAGQAFMLTKRKQQAIMEESVNEQ
jgi:hypothetical protein